MYIAVTTLIRPAATFSHPMGEGIILWDIKPRVALVSREQPWANFRSAFSAFEFVIICAIRVKHPSCRKKRLSPLPNRRHLQADAGIG
jgi:hypothetical protein